MLYLRNRSKSKNSKEKYYVLYTKVEDTICILQQYSSSRLADGIQYCYFMNKVVPAKFYLNKVRFCFSCAL